MSGSESSPRVLYLEPFEAGSHAVFGATLQRLPFRWTALTLPGRHWKWRMRGAVLHFVEKHLDVLRQDFDLIFASSYVDLAMLRSLVPALAPVPTLLYFHENQFNYPTRQKPEHNVDYAYTQFVSALSASALLFNSCFNKDTFLDGAASLIRKMPDFRPNDLVATLSSKAAVLPVPMDLPKLEDAASTFDSDGPLILWNQRWEFDKRPELFFAALKVLETQGHKFRVAVCGQSFRQVPPVFEHARSWLKDRVVHWGFVESKQAYWDLLTTADIVVSTASHEFFGISLLEAAHAGAYPLCPNALAYPEHFPKAHLYETDMSGSETVSSLVHALAALCQRYANGASLRSSEHQAFAAPYGSEGLLPAFRRCIESEIRKVDD